MDFKSTLKRLREAAGMTQEELALRAGYKSQSRIGNYESARSTRTPSLDELPKLADALGCSVGDFFGEAVRDSGGEIDWSNVKAYAQAIGLGNGREAAEYAEAHKLKFRTSSLRRKGLNPDALCVVYGTGDSMLPRIHSGDAILYDTSDTKPSHRTILVIHRNGEYSAKMCRILDDRVYFEALNPDGDHVWKEPRWKDSKRDPIEILGRVRWIGSWED